MNRKTVVLAGGSGFLGTAMTPDLIEQGYQVVVLTRGPERTAGPVRFLHWDAKTLGPWAGAIEGAEAVVNLAGKSVNCRYTEESRREIVASRVDSVRVIGQAIARCARPPRVLIQAASAAIYGDRGDEWLDENSPPGEGFSPQTCVRWEAAFNETPTPGTRRVLLRIGFVLGRGGGALGTLTKLARAFLGGTVGSGRQWISWLHARDLNRIVLVAIERDTMTGTYLAVTPTPVRNREFMRELRRAVHRPWAPPAPEWAVRIGSRLLGTEPELALYGRRCRPAKLLAEGFASTVADLRTAMEDLV